MIKNIFGEKLDHSDKVRGRGWPVHRKRVAEKSIIVINRKNYPIMVCESSIDNFFMCYKGFRYSCNFQVFCSVSSDVTV